MSGIFPLSPKPSAISIKTTTPTITSMSQSGKRFVRRIGSQYWSLSLTFSFMRKLDYMTIDAFIASQGGEFGSFEFYSHNLATPQGDAAGRTPKVATDLQTGTSVVTKGWGANNVTVLKSGDIIRFSNHSKVYKIVSDVSTSATDTGSGTTTISFMPALIKATTLDDVILVENVPYRVHIDGSDTSYSASGVDLYDFSLNFREEL